jgi:hypothetical protein
MSSYRKITSRENAVIWPRDLARTAVMPLGATASRPLCRRRLDADRCLSGMQSTSMSSEVVVVDAPERSE